jgi:RNA polymerase sigma factor (sigma-70 family)
MTQANSTLTLIEKAQKGNHSAQCQLLGIWYPRVYQYCLASLMNHDAAMEASQKTFICVWKKLETLKDRAKFKSWLFAIAQNQCLEERRIDARQLNGKNGYVASGYSNLQHSTPNPETFFIQQELKDSISLAIQALPPEQRQVVQLKEFEGMKFKEISAVLGVSENTVKSRLYYAFKHLRAALKKENINQNGFDDER